MCVDDHEITLDSRLKKVGYTGNRELSHVFPTLCNPEKEP